MSKEQTLSIIKPDAVERNLTEDIKKIFINNNLKIKESKKIHITKDEASDFSICIFFSLRIENPLFLNISLISLSKFLSTASGLIIESVCSMLLIIILY